ncbi:MAG: hypothetical protein Q8L55_01755 [Phycisphaerales bacterium]|nr:hypothetical protein [Phycisphaerales bacterium]
MPLPQSGGQGLGALSDPIPLPSPPFLERWFLQDPVPTAIFFVVVAVLGWWWLQRSGKARAAWITAAAAALAAGGTLLLAGAVVTQREALAARCTDLVNLTLAAQADAVDPFLRPDVSVTILSSRSQRTKADILKYIKGDQLAKYDAKDAALRWVTATLDGPNVARTQCRVQVRAPWSDGWLPTVWMINWTRESENAPWQVLLIEAQQIGLMPQQSISDF